MILQTSSERCSLRLRPVYCAEADNESETREVGQTWRGLSTRTPTNQSIRMHQPFRVQSTAMSLDTAGAQMSFTDEPSHAERSWSRFTRLQSGRRIPCW